jgi:C-terminal processing protease CtpA/Prc
MVAPQQREEGAMAREPDLDSPAATAQLEAGDCVADVGAEVLERTAAFHGNQEPPDTVIDEGELV